VNKTLIRYYVRLLYKSKRVLLLQVLTPKPSPEVLITTCLLLSNNLQSNVIKVSRLSILNLATALSYVRTTKRLVMHIKLMFGKTPRLWKQDGRLLRISMFWYKSCMLKSRLTLLKRSSCSSLEKSSFHCERSANIVDASAPVNVKLDQFSDFYTCMAFHLLGPVSKKNW